MSGSGLTGIGRDDRRIASLHGGGGASSHPAPKVEPRRLELFRRTAPFPVPGLHDLHLCGAAVSQSQCPRQPPTGRAKAACHAGLRRFSPRHLADDLARFQIGPSLKFSTTRSRTPCARYQTVSLRTPRFKRPSPIGGGWGVISGKYTQSLRRVGFER